MKVLLNRLTGIAAAASLVSLACGSDPVIPKLELATAALPDAMLGAAYSGQLQASGGQKPYTFSISAGALPNGVELNPSTGALSGIGAKAGRFNFTAEVRDTSAQTASAMLSIYTIPDPLQIVTTLLPSGKEGSAYDQTLAVRGGVEPYAWSVASGTLPQGLAVSREGVVAGTPTEFGGFDFTVRVTDAEDTAREQPLHLTLSSQNPMIETSTIEKGRVDQPYAVTLSATGGEPPYTWSVANGALPAGVDLATTGELAGTPTEAGEFTVMVVVRDAAQRSDMADFTLRVIAPLSIETTVLPQVLGARPYRFQLEASGGVPPYEWSLGSGDLPPGITLGADGLLQGMSAMVADYEVTVRVRDSEGFQRSALLTLRVSDRYTYVADQLLRIPAVCSSTSVSYVNVPIEVNESFQVADVNVAIDIGYSWNPNNTRQRRNHDRSVGAPRISLFSPNGTEAVLCGNGADIPGGIECEARDLRREYDDDGPSGVRPERPLSAFDGSNPLGTWTLQVAIAEPSCNLTGMINSVSLSLQDDRSTEPYVHVRGFRKNNLVTEPWVRICTPDCGGVGENELFLDARIYEVGPNGYPEGGAGDDVESGMPMTWSWQGQPLAGVDLQPDGHISTFDSGIRTCGNTTCYGTGQRTIVASGGGLVANLILRVLPPDWNPQRREY